MLIKSVKQALEMTKLKELAQLRRQVRRLTKPSGSKKSPARSCVDLQLNKPHVSDGRWPGGVFCVCALFSKIFRILLD